MAFRTPWPICAACQAIPIEVLIRSAVDGKNIGLPLTHFLHGSFDAFRLSASRGCHACTLLYEAVREPFKSGLHTAPICLESARGSDDKFKLVLSADLGQIQRFEDSLELALSEVTLREEDKGFNKTPIADVRFVFDASDIPATARNYRGNEPDFYLIATGLN